MRLDSKHMGLVAVIWCIAKLCSCQNNIDVNDIDKSVAPLKVSYKKDTYEASRKWIMLQDDKRKIQLSVFIYIPVTADSTIAMDVLPLPEWQANHYKDIAPKVGTKVAAIAANSKFDQAVNGITPLKKFPLLIFGPGLGWLPTDYNNIILPLVRSGIVVAGFAATPISKSVYFPGGLFSSVKKPVADYIACAQNISYAANELIRLSLDSNSSVYSIIDTGRIIAGGHSVSGASALLAAHLNSNIKAIINLDGDVNETIAAIQPIQSILYITSQPQGVKDTAISTWTYDKSEKRRDASFEYNAALAESAFRLKIPGMYHSDFLDIAQVKDSLEEKYKKNRFGHINQDTAYGNVIQAIQLFIASGFRYNNKWEIFREVNKHVYLEIKVNN